MKALKKKLHPAGNNQLYFIFILFIYIYTSYPERRDLFFFFFFGYIIYRPGSITDVRTNSLTVGGNNVGTGERTLHVVEVHVVGVLDLAPDVGLVNGLKARGLRGLLDAHL